jgi:hypothetical protein
MPEQVLAPTETLSTKRRSIRRRDSADATTSASSGRERSATTALAERERGQLASSAGHSS